MNKVKVNEESLNALRLPELQKKYAEIVGVPTRTPNKAWLVRKILETATTHATAAKKSATATKTIASTKTMSVEELRARHHELIGRPTSSTDVAYLRWRLRQAERGVIRVGSEPRVSHGAGGILVLPLRMPAFVVEQMDDARRRLGLVSRAELFRRALHGYFIESGEREVAELLLRGAGAEVAGTGAMSDARS